MEALLSSADCGVPRYSDGVRGGFGPTGMPDGPEYGNRLISTCAAGGYTGIAWEGSGSGSSCGGDEDNCCGLTGGNLVSGAAALLGRSSGRGASSG